MKRDNTAALVDVKGLLLHSFATAAAAEWLARLRRRALASDAFIGGLLHNLGILAQVHLDPSGIKAIIDARRIDAARDIRLLESEHAAVRHEECAATIFAAWQLPEALVVAAHHHHDPMAAPQAHRELTALIHLGANLALSGGNTFMLELAPTARDLPAMNLLGISAEDLDRAASELPGRFDELRGALLSA